jgi:hypothetical protein
MHDRFFDPNFGAAALPAWATVLLYALSIVPWIVVPALLIWAAGRWLALPRPTAENDPALAPATPSAVELLRRRYVLGEIDALTFEQMLGRLLHSEEAEAAAQQAAVEGHYPGYPGYPGYPSNPGYPGYPERPSGTSELQG